MRNVLHLANDGDAKTACGAKIILCDDYTDVADHVDCGRCKRTKAFTTWDPRRFTVDIWNHEGDVVHCERHQTAEQVEQLHVEWRARPGNIVEVTEE